MMVTGGSCSFMAGASLPEEQRQGENGTSDVRSLEELEASVKAIGIDIASLCMTIQESKAEFDSFAEG